MIRIFALTEAGARLGERLKTLLLAQDSGAEVTFELKPQPFAETVQTAFEHGERLILICATGIAVRTLAPVLIDKYRDPAVLVLDEQGEFVIPLLSGHEGGANEWGRQVSDLLNAQLAMTTAQPYLQPVYTVGMGCERGCSQSHLLEFLTQCLQQQGLALDDIVSINSIDIKADEVGLIELAKNLGKSFQTYSAEILAAVNDQLVNPSQYVYDTVGVYGVAESAALWSAQQATGNTAELIQAKLKTPKATCAIARAYPPGAGSIGQQD
ncbi:MAG TPA: cobalamin biosynthesis protein CbiG [Oceanospirillaceae bacterium]|nr:cobalamin biosynthesis protein CbiG [Oceanospirillaceae bacterium]